MAERAAKKTESKAVEAKARKRPAPPVVKPEGVDLGDVWEFESESPVVITRPDGSTARVMPFGGLIRHVLDLPGVYVAGDEAVDAQAEQADQ
jgi:hypothetical protein